jgi:hypothetical protein
VDSLGVSNIFEVRDAATPVVQVYNGGAVHLTGNIDGAGASFTSGSIAAPTAVGTATPALYINNAGVSDQIAIADGGVVAFQMYNGGGAKFAAPTAIGTAVPGLIVDSLGVSNILEVRDAATPVFAVENGGTVNGLVLKYAVANTSVVFGTATFSASKTVATGLTSATFCMCSPKSDFAGDTGWCTASPSSGNVVLKLWKINSTPTATTVDQDVTWVCIGI